MPYSLVKGYLEVATLASLDGLVFRVKVILSPSTILSHPLGAFVDSTLTLSRKSKCTSEIAEALFLGLATIAVKFFH